MYHNPQQHGQKVRKIGGIEVHGVSVQLSAQKTFSNFNILVLLLPGLLTSEVESGYLEKFISLFNCSFVSGVKIYYCF
jgi:hypothetical protein